MIHNVKLPPETKDTLDEVVQLQMVLLTFAVDQETAFSEEQLCDYLAGTPSYIQHASKIAEYIMGKGGRQGKFGIMLKAIIDGCDGGNLWGESERSAELKEEKARVVEWMKRDIARLSDDVAGDTFEFYMVDNTVPSEFEAACHHIASVSKSGNIKVKYPDWLQAIRSFLQEFYESLSAGLSANLFKTEQSYQRQDYFRAFTESNGRQYVCAICDEASFRTISRKSDDQLHFHSDIEHYFPQSIYPHLSCHPYNLIPICKFCNQALHGDKDPLRRVDGTRRNLGEVFLPYRTGGLAESGYLMVDWQNDDPGFSIIGRSVSPELKERLQALQSIYDIPGRWQEKRDEIGDHLWRRIRDFLADDIEVTDVFDSVDQIERKLNRLLAYMHDDLGRDPLSFPALWWLASSLESELGEFTDSAFLAEIHAWIAVDEARKKQLDTQAKELRDVVAQSKFTVTL